MKKITLLITLFYNLFVFSQTFSLGDFTYNITNTSTNAVEVIEYQGLSSDLILPAVILTNGIGYRLTRIGDNAFENKSLTSITFQSSVTSIGDSAFKDNSLTSITIPNSVTSIGDSAFENNSLTSVTIPDSVTSLGNRAFSRNQLTNVTISNSITSIGDQGFSANSLTSVVIPNSVTSIGGGAFFNNSLTSVTISNSVTSIGIGAFSNNLLTSVTIPDSVTRIEAFTFSSNSLTTVLIPDSVTFLGQGAFRDNSLTIITIPSSVTTIEDTVFATNPITDVISASLTPAFLPSNAFGNKDDINLVIPEGTTSIYTNQNWIDFRLTIEDPTLTTNTPTFLEDNIGIDNYTNPDYITISTTNAIQVKGVDIYGISGAKILSSVQSQIATASLTHGIYILQIITNKGNFIKKFVR